MNDSKRIFKKIDFGIGAFENVCVGITFFCIVVLVSVGIFYRYILKSGIMWAAEVQQVLAVAMVMFGCAKATREAGHTELNSVIKMFPRKGRIAVRALTSAAVLVFMAVFFVTSIQYTMDSGDLKTIVLRIPYRFCYMFLPIGMGLNLYEFIKRIPQRVMIDPPEDY